MIFFSPVFSQNVFFGERNLNNGKLALYFDQQGTVYPDYLIPDSSLQRCSGNVVDWYKCNPRQFGEVCRNYNCLFQDSNPQNLEVLQDSIIGQVSRRINAEAGKSVTFLVHGYRKSFNDIETGISSVREFEMLRNELDSLQLKSNLYVEVYWDATYNCCFSANKKKNDSLFRQFELAQQNAPQIGLSLRKILKKIESEKINIIGHSLGCKVAVSALFNAWNSGSETPSNPRINLCLIAPAIGGITVFQHYYERNTSLDFRKQDNYQLYILYNENDFVLKKKDNKFGLFGPGTMKYGETTLGCNHKKEAVKLERYFRENFPNSVIQEEKMNFLGKNHSLRCYAVHGYLRNMVDFLNKN